MTVPILEGVSSFASWYDAMILDLWGLIHDGVAPYPGVPDCLDRLRGGGTRVLLLSKRAAAERRSRRTASGNGNPG